MHSLPKLDYAYDALEPHIDAKTMEIHYTKHHQAYVDKLNAVLQNFPGLQKKTVEQLLLDFNSVPAEIKTAVRNHGGGHANHSLFWKLMSPNGGGEATGNLADAISNAFKSFDEFKKKFSDTAAAHFGSGWAWLAVDNGKLSVYSTPNQDSLLMENKIPVLGLDVWEHAYYLKFQNRRAEYIAVWWNVVNWKRAEENFRKAMK